MKNGLQQKEEERAQYTSASTVIPEITTLLVEATQQKSFKENITERYTAATARTFTVGDVIRSLCFLLIPGLLLFILTSSYLSTPKQPQLYISPQPPRKVLPANDEPKLDKPAWTYWMTCFAALLGGGGAITTALIARATAEAKRKSDEATAKQARESSERVAKDRHEQERLHFARKELHDQFVDIQNRFEKTDPAMKASAALRLATFAERLEPGQEMKTVSEPNLPRPEPNEENNPYFLTVAKQLATALYLEDRPVVRKAIRDALAQMTKFAAKAGREQILLHQLSAVLADANRTAKDAFIIVMAEWAVATHAKNQTNLSDKVERIISPPTGILCVEDFDLLADVTSFCKSKEATIACLRSLTTEGEERANEWTNSAPNTVTKPGKYTLARVVYTAKRQSQTPEERVKADALLLLRLEILAQQLTDTRDALVMALGNEHLCLPCDFPKERLAEVLAIPDFLPEESLIQQYRELQNAIRAVIGNSKNENVWQRRYPISLSHCFLAGAILTRAHLPGVNLRGTHLAGADLAFAQLSGAELSSAHLVGADLSEAQLLGSTLSKAQLSKTSFYNANLSGADMSLVDAPEVLLRRARLIGTKLWRAQLENGDLSGSSPIAADFTHANLRSADISEANCRLTNFFKARLIEAKLMHTQLDRANMQEAQLLRADLSWAQLIGANLRQTLLQKAHLQFADLTNAELVLANIEDAFLLEAHLIGTKLYGIYVSEGNKEGIGLTDFSGTNLTNALLAPVHRGMATREATDRTKRFKTWLQEQFPEEASSMLQDAYPSSPDSGNVNDA